jgi:hypothetical protein
MKKTALLIVLAASTILPFCATAQHWALESAARYNQLRESDNPGFWYEYYRSSDFGMGLVYPNASLEAKYTIYNDKDELVDGHFSKKLSTKLAYNVIESSSHRLTMFDHDKTLALGYGFMGNMILWEVGDVELYPGEITNEQMASMHVGLIASLDYKVGGDAVSNKAKKFCFAAGAGLYPHVMQTLFADLPYTKFSTTPFLKMEIGYVLGIAFKLRATYMFSGMNYFNAKADVLLPGESYRIYTKSRPELTLSLLLMPFSWDWENDRW